MKDFNDINPIHLYGLEQLISTFLEEKNLSVVDSYKKMSKKLPWCGASIGANMCLANASHVMTLEMIVMLAENFKTGGLDFGSPQIKKLLKEIKSDLPDDMKNMNGAELLVALRHAIAHNSKENQNLAQKSVERYEVNIRKKGVENSAIKTFGQVDFLKVLLAYDASMKREVFGSWELEDGIDTPKKLIDAFNKRKTFNGIIHYKDKNGKELPFDEYQDRAFYWFLVKNKSVINSYGHFDLFIKNFLPLKGNKFSVYDQKCFFIVAISPLMNWLDITAQEYMKLMKKQQFSWLLQLVDKEFAVSIIKSSIAFSICASKTPEEIFELFKSQGCEIDEETARHLRNSFVHGRYFYNFKGGFEIYDGKNDNALSHIITIKTELIDALCKQACTQKKCEIDKLREFELLKRVERGDFNQGKFDVTLPVKKDSSKDRTL